MVDLKTKKKKKGQNFNSNGNVVVCDPKRAFYTCVVLSLFMLFPFWETVLEFNQGATGREAGTALERVAAHLHSKHVEQARESKHQTFYINGVCVVKTLVNTEQKDKLPSLPTSPGRAPVSATRCHSCP